LTNRQFNELSDSTQSDIDISMGYVEPAINYFSSLSYSNIFGTPSSSVQDPDDDEILSHSHLLLLADSHVDVDVHDTRFSYQNAPNIPPHSVRLMLPLHVHSAFPGCIPSTPATSQQIPQVGCHLSWDHLLRLVTGAFYLFRHCGT
jgi:hypothetical protein